MKDLIQPLIDLIKMILQREKGTKFLVAIGAMGVIVYMAMNNFGSPIESGLVALVAALYFFADYKAKKDKTNGEEK